MATRADVAKLAGVSASTVSYALSGARPITPQTRARIEAAMQELGYTPNALASGLAGRRSRILALLLPMPRGIDSADLEYVVAAADATRERGYHLVLWPLADGELAEVRRLGGSGLVDGVLLMEVRLTDSRVDYLRSAEVPLALIGRTSQVAGLAYADCDFDQISSAALDHLAGLGHRAVGFVNVPARMTAVGYGPSVRVGQGLQAAAARHGLRLVEVDCEHTVAAGRMALGELRARLPELTAVVSFNWEATLGVMQRAAADGLSVPADLSVLLMTNSDARADVTVPALTSICPPAGAIGRAAALALIERLEQPGVEPDQVLLPGTLVVRGSTGLVRGIHVRPDLTAR